MATLFWYLLSCNSTNLSPYAFSIYFSCKYSSDDCTKFSFPVLLSNSYLPKVIFVLSFLSLIYIFPTGIHTYSFPWVFSFPAETSCITIPFVTSSSTFIILNPAGTTTLFPYLSFTSVFVFSSPVTLSNVLFISSSSSPFIYLSIWFVAFSISSSSFLLAFSYIFAPSLALLNIPSSPNCKYYRYSC